MLKDMTGELGGGRSASNPKVAIIALLIPEYKVHLFGGLHEAGAVQVLVCHSGRGDKDSSPAYEGSLSFPQVRVRSLRIPVWRGRCLHYQRVIGEIDRYGPDVVIMQDGVRIISNLVVRAWCKRRGIPIIFYTQGRNHQANNRGLFWRVVAEKIRSSLLRDAEATIAYTKRVAEEMIGSGVARTKVFISPNTLDLNRLSEDVSRVSESELEGIRRALRIQSGRVVLFIGRLIREKRPDLLIEAAKVARRAGKPFQVLMVGDGPLRPALDRLAAESDSLDVTFLGHLPFESVAPYLRLSALVCVPGDTGLAITHAFAAGRPYVTCTSCGHGPEICNLREGENGWMVSPPTADALAKKLTDVMENRGVLEIMGERASAFVRSECDPAKQRDGFLEAITAVLGRNASPGPALGDRRGFSQ